jgi:ankyrin repeat protein
VCFVKRFPLVLWCAGVTAWGADLRLIDAVRDGDSKTVHSLLYQHVDLNVTEPDGATALAYATHADDVPTVELLIKAGADVNHSTDYGETPLSLACSNGDSQLVSLLLKAGAKANAPRWSGETPLMIAARIGSTESVRLLVEAGADPNARESERGQTALMWAAAGKHPDIVQLLIDHGADPNAASKSGFTALLFAAQQGDVGVARALLLAGVDVNSKPNGSNALIITAASGHGALGKFLLVNGAQPNVKDRFGMTPLHMAAQAGMVALVEELLARGADPNARLEKMPPNPADGFTRFKTVGATPFLLAARSGHADVMRALIAAHVDTSLNTDDGTTPLIAAASSANIEAVKLAFELGGDINATNRLGQTAVHAAVRHIGPTTEGIDEVIQFLADHGARLDTKDDRGMTPLDICDKRTIDRTGDLIKKLMTRKTE